MTTSIDTDTPCHAIWLGSPEPCRLIARAERNCVPHEVWRGESVAFMERAAAEGRLWDAVVCDPPYCSGGSQGMRAVSRSTADKYCQTQTKNVPDDFHGDGLTEVQFAEWCRAWMRRAHNVTRPGGLFLFFIDWRNLGNAVSAAGIAGWNVRSVAVWDKTTQSRPVRGLFRFQSEYIVVCSKGKPDLNADVYLPGVLRYPPASQTGAPRLHITQKPEPLMGELLRAVVCTGLGVLDPFAGSGTTLIAAAAAGVPSCGVEYVPSIADTCAARVAAFCGASSSHELL